MNPNHHVYRAAFFGLSKKLANAIAPDDDKLLKDLRSKACSGPCNQGRSGACPCPQACQIDSEEELVSIVKTLLAVLCAMLAFAILLLWSDPAHAAEAETTATIAAAADTGSTVAVVATGVGVEGNALLAHPAVFAAVAVAKLAAPRLTRDMEPETRRFALRSMTTFWGAAAVNNVALLLGAGCPPCLGVAAGVALWIREGQRDPEPITAPEADAVLALAGYAEVVP